MSEDLIRSVVGNPPTETKYYLAHFPNGKIDLGSGWKATRFIAEGNRWECDERPDLWAEYPPKKGVFEN